MRILSSNAARNAPSGLASAFLICPRIPDTVLMLAPSNLATSSAELNMSLMNAVFLKILYGTPVSLSFLTILVDRSTSSTTPVADTRNPGRNESSVLNAQKPVLGRETGP